MAVTISKVMNRLQRVTRWRKSTPVVQFCGVSVFHSHNRANGIAPRRTVVEHKFNLVIIDFGVLTVMLPGTWPDAIAVLMVEVSLTWQ